MTATYWLDGEGARVAVGPASVLVGRSPDCDVVIDDLRVSRHHALFRMTEDGVEVIPFGREPVAVNGEPCIAPTTLRPGDRVACVEHGFTIVLAPPAAPPTPALLWGVERTKGALFRVTGASFRVGGAPDDQLVIAGWPPTVFTLHAVGDGMAIEALREGVSVGDAALAAGEFVRVEPNTRVAFGGTKLRVVALPGDPLKATDALHREGLPTSAELLFLPRGGRLTVRYGTRERSVYLSDRRCDLVATLLRPPPPFAPGDLIPEEVLLERIWPQKTQGRVELNTLVFRTRRDLIKADINGGEILERSGGGARFRAAEGAVLRVTTESA